MIAPLFSPVRQRQVDTGGRRLLAKQRFRLLLFSTVAQAVGGFQHLVTLQAVRQRLNVAVPLVARQRVQMRQRRPVLIVTGQVQPAGVNLIRIARFLTCQLTHQVIRLAALTRAIQIA